MPHWKTIFPSPFNKEKSGRSKPFNLFHLLHSCDCVSLFLFFPQINKINLTALLQKRMKGVLLWNEVWVEMPYTGWCSEISMKQHQRKQRDSSVLYKGPCELSKCLRSHYWQHFFALQVFTWWPYGFHRSADADFLSSEMARTEWKTQSLRRQAVRHRHN